MSPASNDCTLRGLPGMKTISAENPYFARNPPSRATQIRPCPGLIATCERSSFWASADCAKKDKTNAPRKLSFFIDSLGFTAYRTASQPAKQRQLDPSAKLAYEGNRYNFSQGGTITCRFMPKLKISKATSAIRAARPAPAV